MPLPLIPIVLGTAAVGAGAALHAWLTNETDAWSDKTVFNTRMAELHRLALALNDGFAACPAFMADKAKLGSWQGNRDNFGAFYGEVGKLNYFDPSDEQIAQAKDFASKFYFWSGEYERLKCGTPVTPHEQKDPYTEPPQPTDWLSVTKWAAIGVGGLFVLKTLSDLFRPYQR